MDVLEKEVPEPLQHIRMSPLGMACETLTCSLSLIKKVACQFGLGHFGHEYGNLGRTLSKQEERHINTVHCFGFFGLHSGVNCL